MKHVTLITPVMLTITMILSGCGIKPERTAVQEETAAPATEETAKVFTDDDFIDYWAQTAYLTEKYAENPIKLGEELGKLHEKYAGIEEKYLLWMTEWQQKVIADPENASKQWEEIMKRVETRANELKGGI